SFLIAEKAREGRTVARLKWGDPFVFDSGGKEALFLHEQGVPFEVVPGIPAAIGGLAYAGVPITYPDAGDVVVLIRGHEAETDASPDVDWTALARLHGTLVCFAGARQIAAMATALVAHGRNADETAALIYDGSLPSQRTIQATLGSIAEDLDPDRAALFIVGSVVGLRDHLRWYDERPLFGKRIAVTRSREQASELVEMLEDRGAEVVLAPTIQILPPDDPEALDRACAEASTYDWLIFTSTNGVDHFMERLLATGDIRDLKGVRICTVGPSTASRLARFGLRIDLTPSEFRAEAIVQVLKERGPLEGTRVLLPRADLARELIADELREAGATVTDVVAYRTVVGGAEAEETDLYRMLLDRQIDAITFTSASTVRNLATILGPDQTADLLRTTVVACIGPVTAEAAQRLGIETAVMPARYTIPDLVDALVEHFGKRG
ncbi:MAG: uroporphyrinogen-III synthase, partial [Vicinamibacterales bacterium]